MADKKTILIIDDEPLVRQSLVAFLEDCGYKVFEASNGEEGVAMFMRERPNVVLTDMRMPKLDGLGVLTALKAVSPQTPIIALSGIGDAADEALRRGAAVNIAKPILDLDDLLEAIASVGG